ncbi:MAG: hypothetical protein MUF87_18945 [Anaerolineae bacterium]|jgi:hypothetical protein|nr:hypothetical protein [Anaerolineae bacterium]
MTELYDRIMEQKGSFERLVARIPGFKGYQEKQARRTADRMLRDYIAGEIEKRVDRLVRSERRILDKLGLGLMTKTREAKTAMQTYHDMVKTAAPKYDGMWAQMKIGSVELEKIYNFDEAQIRYVDRFDELLTALEAAIESKDGVETAVENLYAAANEAQDAFSLRDQVLTDLSKSL